MRLRAKLYSLMDNGSWMDLGTGWASIEGENIVITFESRGIRKSPHRFSTAVSPNPSDYQIEGETIISFVDPSTKHDYSLSFLVSSARETMWKRIQQIQASKLTDSIPSLEEDSVEPFIDFCTSHSSTAALQQMMIRSLLSDDYLVSFITLHGSKVEPIEVETLIPDEQLVSQLFKDRGALSATLKQLFFLNEPSIIIPLLTDSVFPHLLACLEFQPTYLRCVPYRHIFQNTINHRLPFPINDNALLANMRQLHALNFLTGCVISSEIPETSSLFFANLSQTFSATVLTPLLSSMKPYWLQIVASLKQWNLRLSPSSPNTPLVPSVDHIQTCLSFLSATTEMLGPGPTQLRPAFSIFLETTTIMDGLFHVFREAAEALKLFSPTCKTVNNVSYASVERILLTSCDVFISIASLGPDQLLDWIIVSRNDSSSFLIVCVELLKICRSSVQYQLYDILYLVLTSAPATTPRIGSPPVTLLATFYNTTATSLFSTLLPLPQFEQVIESFQPPPQPYTSQYSLLTHLVSNSKHPFYSELPNPRTLFIISNTIQLLTRLLVSSPLPTINFIASHFILHRALTLLLIPSYFPSHQHLVSPPTLNSLQQPPSKAHASWSDLVPFLFCKLNVSDRLIEKILLGTESFNQHKEQQAKISEVTTGDIPLPNVILPILLLLDDCSVRDTLCRSALLETLSSFGVEVTGDLTSLLEKKAKGEGRMKMLCRWLFDPIRNVKQRLQRQVNTEGNSTEHLDVAPKSAPEDEHALVEDTIELLVQKPISLTVLNSLCESCGHTENVIHASLVDAVVNQRRNLKPVLFVTPTPTPFSSPPEDLKEGDAEKAHKEKTTPSDEPATIALVPYEKASTRSLGLSQSPSSFLLSSSHHYAHLSTGIAVSPANATRPDPLASSPSLFRGLYGSPVTQYLQSQLMSLLNIPAGKESQPPHALASIASSPAKGLLSINAQSPSPSSLLHLAVTASDEEDADPQQNEDALHSLNVSDTGLTDGASPFVSTLANSPPRPLAELVLQHQPEDHSPPPSIPAVSPSQSITVSYLSLSPHTPGSFGLHRDAHPTPSAVPTTEPSLYPAPSVHSKHKIHVAQPRDSDSEANEGDQDPKKKMGESREESHDADHQQPALAAPIVQTVWNSVTPVLPVPTEQIIPSDTLNHVRLPEKTPKDHKSKHRHHKHKHHHSSSRSHHRSDREKKRSSEEKKGPREPSTVTLSDSLIHSKKALFNEDGSLSQSSDEQDT
ncbi:hypothetical protein BLNAU_11876 [Blattamonas nauphoetae]|uniref:Serine/threonine-protein phosphatase 4 regulatory subunit 3-like central domain-containing protein n=1 Tax=Blattamonas nauphoetae TaxID=2049346 RepID=A0ABQ9XKY2_9EUKA|nr:hypothetical protein BLNAU_11876 [Blattamonas nauphoetae]